MATKIVNPNQEAVNNFLRVPKQFKRDKNITRFSPFKDDQALKASELAAEFMQIAESNPDNFLDKVLETAQKRSETEDPELVRWSLMIFITHDAAARKAKLRIPPLNKRTPESTFPKRKQVPFTAPGPIVSDKPTPPLAAQTGDVELLLVWYREDPNFNEHHEHWHIVYPGSGVRGPGGRLVPKDRHGELFIYMHRQMLARYDIERLSMGIPIVKPLDNYRDVIPEGYHPDDDLVDEKDRTPFATRLPNKKLRNLDEMNSIETMERNRKDIEDVIKNGKFFNGTAITANLLGSTIESSAGSVSRQRYGSLHNLGHVMLAYINDPNPEDPDDPGVMTYPRVAARDPVFWRWHRHIDDLFNKWQETLTPNDFSESPPVNIRNGDIILAFKDKLPIRHGPNQDKEANDFGVKTFGGTNFDADVSKSEYVTHELQTKMKQRDWHWPEDSRRTERIEYLFPREYYYYFRVENTSSSQLEATFRVYLAPEEMADSRRHWIELDKFKQTLPPKSKTVVSRDCDMSSVVRQPPQKTEDELDDTADIPGAEEKSLEEKYCDCGWPFHLLLPRGRKEGMKFKLLVFITDWSKDQVPTLSRCGSVSFCGAERPYDKYPDGKPMGYPFDRPFKDNSYKKTFEGLHNATIKDVTIRWVDNFPEISTT